MDSISITRLLFFPQLKVIRKAIWPNLTDRAVMLAHDIYFKPNNLQRPKWLYEKTPSALRIIHTPKQKLIFLALQSGLIEIWDLKKRLCTIRGHAKSVTSFLFFKESIWASSSLDSTVCFWQGREQPQLLRRINLKTPICQLYRNKKGSVSALAQSTYQIFHLSQDGLSEKIDKFLPLEMLNHIQRDQKDGDKKKLLLRTQSEPLLINTPRETPRKKTL